MIINHQQYQLITQSISYHRRRIAAISPYHFAKVYLGEHCKLPFSRMHNELFELLSIATSERKQKIAVAAPRGHAKSTVVSLTYVLWSILYDHDKYVILVSATQEQSKQLLKNIKDETQFNPLLLEDFPRVCMPPGAKGRPVPWRANQIVLHNGTMIRAIGSGQSIRGTKHREHRPSLVIVDDLENQEQCETAEQRHKLDEWFRKVLMHVGDSRTNYIIVGTIMHYDSLLANLTSEKLEKGKGIGWIHRKYQAVEQFSDHPEMWEEYEKIYLGEREYVPGYDTGIQARTFFEDHEKQMLEGTQVLWPEREDYHQLMELRVQDGKVSFQTEKQNEPLDPDQCLFREDEFRFWDDDFKDVSAVIEHYGNQMILYGACDPSMGQKMGYGDYTAIITIGFVRSKNLYIVLDADISRRKPEQTIRCIIDKCRLFRYRSFAFEANQFQEIMAGNLREQSRAAGVHCPARSVVHTNNKQGRIEAMHPLISTGALRFSRKQALLLEQLRQFPLGAHDDGPDALEMAVAEIIEYPPVRYGTTTGLGS